MLFDGDLSKTKSGCLRHIKLTMRSESWNIWEELEKKCGNSEAINFTPNYCHSKSLKLAQFWTWVTGYDIVKCIIHCYNKCTRKTCGWWRQKASPSTEIPFLQKLTLCWHIYTFSRVTSCDRCADSSVKVITTDPTPMDIIRHLKIRKLKHCLTKIMYT
jgi:hypothetical protein